MEPTKGRIVYYKNEIGEEYAAIITKVWTPECVNLQVFMDSDVLPVTSVRQGEENNQWDWMPFQKDQLSRPGYTEAAKKQGQRLESLEEMQNHESHPANQ